MKCPNCKRIEMRSSSTPYFMDLSGHYVIVENVPCHKCEKCGEVYFSASVLERIDGILEELDGIESRIFLVDYWKAA